MEKNVIYCGECTEIMHRHIPDNSIDLTMTSPPYDELREYNGYTFKFKPIAAELWRVTKPGGVVVWVVGDATINGSETGTSFRQALGFMELGFNLHDTMIYQKPHVTFPDNNRYFNGFEYMFVFSKREPATFNLITDRVNKYAGDKVHGTQREIDGTTKRKSSIGNITPRYGRRFNVWMVPNAGKANSPHPAPFPEALARDHIISWSNPGDIVLDPMAGSGTTLKMAVEQGRQYIGIDISQEYCDLAQERVNAARIPLPGLFIPPTIVTCGGDA